MLDVLAMAQQCAPTVHPQTMAALVSVESSGNPFAIGVVGGRLARQPANLAEAVATVRALERDGWNFSVGIAQVNRYNLPRYGLDYEAAFDPCASLRVGSLILQECFERARAGGRADQSALQAAFSCYYSGNFQTGFRPDFPGQPSYVEKVLASAARLTGSAPAPIAVVPSRRGAAAPSRSAPRREALDSGGPADTGGDLMVFGSDRDADAGAMVFHSTGRR